MLDGQDDLRALATPILAALALGALLAAGAIRAFVDNRATRRALQGPVVRRFVAESEGGMDAWRELAALSAAGDDAALLARAPGKLAASFRSAAALAFATPSRYEALVRTLSHGGEKDDLATVLGHELNRTGLRPATEDQFLAEVRFRESRDRLRARAARRIEELETELRAARGVVGAAVSLAVAPWPAVLLVGIGSPFTAALSIATTLAAAALASLTAERRAPAQDPH